MNNINSFKIEKPSLKFEEIRFYVYVENTDAFKVFDALCKSGLIKKNRTQLCVNYDIDRDLVVDIPFVTKKVEGAKWFDICLNKDPRTLKHICIKKYVKVDVITAAIKSGGNHFNEYFDIVQSMPTKKDFKRVNGESNITLSDMLKLINEFQNLCYKVKALITLCIPNLGSRYQQQD